MIFGLRGSEMEKIRNFRFEQEKMKIPGRALGFSIFYGL